MNRAKRSIVAKRINTRTDVCWLKTLHGAKSYDLFLLILYTDYMYYQLTYLLEISIWKIGWSRHDVWTFEINVNVTAKGRDIFIVTNNPHS